MTDNRKCQSCGLEAVAAMTAECGNKFGMKWPGGKEQSGHVLPHDMIGLREKGASNKYVNMSWCLACGQIQGKWPTKMGDRYINREERFWEVVVGYRSQKNKTWVPYYFKAFSRKAVEEASNCLGTEPRKCNFKIIREIDPVELSDIDKEAIHNVEE